MLAYFPLKLKVICTLLKQTRLKLVQKLLSKKKSGTQKGSEYGQEIPQSHTADQPTAP